MSELTLYLVGFMVAAAASLLAVPAAIHRGLFRYPFGQSGRLGITVPIDGPTIAACIGLPVLIGGVTAFFLSRQTAFALANLTPLVILGLLGGVRWHWIWRSPRGMRSIGVAVLAVFVAFPLAELVMTGLSALLLVARQPLGMQVPVQMLLNARGSPVLLASILISVVVVAPLCEEFFFRGLVQSWLRRYLSRRSGIALSAGLFAGVHFHPYNGLANVTVLPGVFVLGLFLGHLFERERTLWAPITLHGLFNGISVMLALVGGA